MKPERNAILPWLVGLLGLAAAYFVTGKLGLLLAIPPGYATAVWLPSGVALAGLLIFGYRLWPGILLGSFLVNVDISFDGSTLATAAKSLAVAANISLGASVQGLVGAFLIRRVVGFPTALDNARDVGWFLLLGGPASCLINASWSTGTLYFAGSISGQELTFGWLTWWVGDVIGVLTVAPLALTLAGEPREIWRRRRFTVAIPLAITFALSVVFFVQASAWEQARVQRKFVDDASAIRDRLRGSIERYLDVLNAVADFHASSMSFRARDFRAFVAGPLSRYPGIRALSWNPRVPADERTAFEADIRREGYAAFRITERDAQGRLRPSPTRAEHVPVRYIEPYQANRLAHGYDVASDDTRRTALAEARDTGHAVATAAIKLVQEDQIGASFLVFLPVYRQATAPPTIEQRRRQLVGYVTGVFRVHDVVDAAIEGIDPSEVVVELFDASAEARERLFATGEPSAGGDGVETSGGAAAIAWVETLEVAGREWLLRVSATPVFVAAHRSWHAWSMLVAALLLSGLLGAFLLVITGRTSRLESMQDEIRQLNAELEQRVRDRTVRLEAANKELEAFSYSASHDLRAPLRAIDGFSHILLNDYRDKLDDAGKEALARVRGAAQRMAALIDDLLTLARVTRTELALEEVDLSALAREILDALRVEHPNRNVSVDITPGLKVRGDPRLLRVALENLLGNAWKFTSRREEARIEFGRPANAPSMDGTAVLCVRDNGAGFDMKHADKLFTPFARMHRAEEFSGTGIGLATVQRVVRKHGGQIWAEAAVDQGAVFFLSLPHAPQ